MRYAFQIALDYFSKGAEHGHVHQNKTLRISLGYWSACQFMPC